jgi:cobalamin synthase
MNWKQSLPSLRKYYGFGLEQNHEETSVRKVGVPSEIRTGWISKLMLIVTLVLSVSSFSSFILGPLACFPPEAIWNYGSRRQWVVLLGQTISASQGRYLRRTTKTQKKRAQTSMSPMGLEPTIPVFERVNTFHVTKFLFLVLMSELTYLRLNFI